MKLLHENFYLFKRTAESRQPDRMTVAGMAVETLFVCSDEVATGPEIKPLTELLNCAFL
jgi:hypothetical protein